MKVMVNKICTAAKISVSFVFSVRMHSADSNEQPLPTVLTANIIKETLLSLFRSHTVAGVITGIKPE